MTTYGAKSRTGTPEPFGLKEVRMLSLEQVFRLSSLAILSVLFISVSATAEKKSTEKSTEKPAKKYSAVFTQVGHIEEAELINSGIYNASNLTTIGNRLEIMQGAQNLK